MSLSDRLRTETRPHHTAVERDTPMAWLMTPGLDRDTLAAVLARLHAFQAPLEAALAPRQPATGLDAIDRAARLGRDLAVLGVAPDAPAPPDALPAVVTDAEVRGATYVLEGAALGGQIIARHLGPAFGLDAGRGLSFFASEGAPAGPRWRAVRRMLDATPEADHEAVVAAAQAAFERMGAWMRGIAAAGPPVTRPPVDGGDPAAPSADSSSPASF